MDDHDLLKHIEATMVTWGSPMKEKNKLHLALWPSQAPKLEVLYDTKPYSGAYTQRSPWNLAPYIEVISDQYGQFRFLNWPLIG